MDSSEKPDRILIRDLVDRISKATADRHPEKWEHDTDPIVRTIVETMNAQGWEPDGIPGVLHFICNEITSGRVEAHSAFNDLPCAEVSLIRTNPAQWYVTRKAENHIWQALATAVERAPELAREKRELRAKQSENQRAAKEAAGRYTLEEAAAQIAKNTAARESAVLAELLSDVEKGKLTVYEPGAVFPYRPTKVRKFYEEAYWDNLNIWLDGINVRNPWRFPNPQRPNERTDSKAAKHERAILGAIDKLGLNPMTLQRGIAGEPGAKAEIKSSLPELTDKQFENAWQRLRGAKIIKYSDEPLS